MTKKGIICIFVAIALSGLSVPFWLLNSLYGPVMVAIAFILFVTGIVLVIKANKMEGRAFDKKMEKDGFKYNKEYGDFLCDINRRMWWKRGMGFVYHIDDVVNVTIERYVKDNGSFGNQRYNYRVIIITTNIQKPVVEIDCGKSAVLADNIKATIILLLGKPINNQYSDNICGS